MKHYFYSDGKEKHGPISLDELRQREISKDTLIWFEGLDDWTPAKNLDEIKSILELQPPPISNEEENVSNKAAEMGTNTTESLRSQNEAAPNGMFSNPFSFNGRIRRSEYAISLIIYAIAAMFVNVIAESGKAPIIGFSYIPMLWFLWAQGAKRCHDVGNNGWWQIIPFYVFWLLFENGQPGLNDYGYNPKG